MSKKVSKKAADKRDRGQRKGFLKFFREVNSELRKVTWPSKKELANYTLIVVVTIIIFAAIIGLIDLGLGKLLDLIIN